MSDNWQYYEIKRLSDEIQGLHLRLQAIEEDTEEPEDDNNEAPTPRIKEKE